jgi:antirestriction protein ArdC
VGILPSPVCPRFLVAELGAAFLCADLGITPEVRPDHAAYLQSWLTVLNNDKRFVFSAASHAQRAVDYLHGLQPRQAEAEQAEMVARESARVQLCTAARGPCPCHRNPEAAHVHQPL